MKKQLLLLISLLLPLISGCNEKPSETTNSESTQETTNVYKESDYSKKLNNISYLIGYVEWPFESDYYLSNLFNYDVVIMEYKEEKNYYTCAYMAEEDINKINDYKGMGRFLDNAPLFSGINAYHYKRFEMNDMNDINLKPIKWYEIPKDEKIPGTIGDYTLTMITSEVVYNVYDINGKLLKEQSVFYEQFYHNRYREFYKDKRVLGVIKNIHQRIVKEDYFKKVIVKENDCIDGDHFSKNILFHGQEIELIDGIEYVSVFDTTIRNKETEIDITNSYSYIEETIDEYPYKKYYFKLEDILSFVKSFKN